MIMTQQEQKEMLNLIKEAQDLSAEKTNLMEEIVKTAQEVLHQNLILQIENENLKKQLEIAEKAILRINEPQS